jgi:hypothetical protein
MSSVTGDPYVDGLMSESTLLQSVQSQLEATDRQFRILNRSVRVTNPIGSRLRYQFGSTLQVASGVSRLHSGIRKTSPLSRSPS